MTAETTMLYCPKCQRKYETGSQRFCNNDGGRLLPVVNSDLRGRNQKKEVFTNLLGIEPSSRFDDDERISETPKFVKAPNKDSHYIPLIERESSKTDQNLKAGKSKPAEKTAKKEQSKSAPTVKKEPVKSSRPDTRPENPKEIKKETVKPGGRKPVPTGSLNLTWQNPRILLGQVIKGRYFITQKIDQDKSGIVYIARDKIRGNKDVVIRVLMDQEDQSDFRNKLLKEERISLSRTNHPNVVSIINLGELPEGKPFVVSEYFENESVKAFLKMNGAFNPKRAARIIKQASLALSEAHQNGILHRNLQPQHILLTVSETGDEVVKVSDFCISDGGITNENFIYKAPEQINGQLPTFASDSYSLAIIAYQMLTNRLPFNPASEKELLKSQKKGLTVKASDVNPELNPLIDDILEKSLSFDPSKRYEKARDFGEAFFNALTTSTAWAETDKETDKKDVEISASKNEEESAKPTSVPVSEIADLEKLEDFKISSQEKFITTDINTDSGESELEFEEYEKLEADIESEAVGEKDISPVKDTLWEKRSPEPTKEGGMYMTIFSILGLLILVFGAIGVWRYFSSISESPVENVAQNQLPNKKDPTISDAKNTNANTNSIENPEPPPPQREIIPPKDFQFFENSKQNLSDELAKNFRGFSLYYPKTWEKFDTETNYLDVKLEANKGFPKQQFIVTRYESRGTYEMDKKNFPALVEKSNKDLIKALPNYEVVSEGGITINNGWKAYEVKFKGRTDFDKASDNFEIWGRRIWMPPARPFENNGFVITLLATSLSDKIKGLDDIGKAGELGDILYTFEPAQN